MRGQALHMMAVSQIRYPWTDGCRYYERKRAEGKTPRKHCAASSAGCRTRSAVSIATPTPQAFSVASRYGFEYLPEVPAALQAAVRAAPGPYPAGSSRWIW